MVTCLLYLYHTNGIKTLTTMKTQKKYATMAKSATPYIVFAHSKKEAAEKLQVPVSKIYLY